MCDKVMLQDDGFDLQAWYEEWEFEVADFIPSTNEYAIMIREL